MKVFLLQIIKIKSRSNISKHCYYTFPLLPLPATPPSSLLLQTHLSRPSLHSFTADYHQANSYPRKVVLLKKIYSVTYPFIHHFTLTTLRQVYARSQNNHRYFVLSIFVLYLIYVITTIWSKSIHSFSTKNCCCSCVVYFSFPKRFILP